MHAIVGLGNHGNRYRETRHNVGYRVVEALARKLKTGPPFQYRWSLCALARFNNEKVILSQPLTYMNRSGLAVVELSRRYLLKPSHFLIIHDELDLPLGTIRLKRGGGTAGHHGLESIKEALNSPEFNRLRIGIGRPPADKPGAEYVLERFNEQEIPLLEETVGRAVQATMTFLSKGLDEAMNRFN